MRNTFRNVSYERQLKSDLVNRHFSLDIAKVRFELCIVASLASVLRKNKPAGLKYRSHSTGQECRSLLH